MNVLGIIPARGGSKGIYKKNVVTLNGKPLISYTIEAAKKSKIISRLILSSDDEEIIRVAQGSSVEIPFRRPGYLSRDDTPAIDVIKHSVSFLEKKEDYKPDIIILLQPTSPLRTFYHIDESLELLMSSKADSIVSVIQVPHNFNPFSIMEKKEKYLVPFLSFDERNNLRQKKPVYFARNGAAIYAFTYDCLINKNSIFGDIILPYEMERKDSIDIDDEFDLKICECILKEKTNEN